MKCAHKANEKFQTIEDHLNGVAELAFEYSVELFKPLAYTVTIPNG